MTEEEKKIHNQNEVLKIVKPLSIVLVIAAIFTWLGCSLTIFKFSIKEPVTYEVNFAQLNKVQKPIASGMHKTGKLEHKIFVERSYARNSKKGGYDIFEDVSNRNKKSDAK